MHKVIRSTYNQGIYKQTEKWYSKYSGGQESCHAERGFLMTYYYVRNITTKAIVARTLNEWDARCIAKSTSRANMGYTFELYYDDGMESDWLADYLDGQEMD